MVHDIVSVSIGKGNIINGSGNVCCVERREKKIISISNEFSTNLVSLAGVLVKLVIFRKMQRIAFASVEVKSFFI